MKYIDFAENERLSTIVLGMMRISQMSEDKVEALVEAALSIGINTFDLADIYGLRSFWVKFLSAVRIFGIRFSRPDFACISEMVFLLYIFFLTSLFCYGILLCNKCCATNVARKESYAT